MMNTRPLVAARPFGGLSVTRRVAGGPLVCVLLLALSVLAGCSASPDRYRNTTNEASVTYTGPAYLRGTIGSYGGFLNNTTRYVGGYGVVVDLDATGSNEVPAFMREWLVTEMLRNNLGSVKFGTEQFTPERVMADLGSSVVSVEGLIPPGAARGSKFDILVSMIDQTSTSLAGGRLFWQTQLAPAGLDRQLIYTETLATGYGRVFVNPTASAADQRPEFLRQAVIVNGGTVLETQGVQFVLNAPSNRISALIADRINERFESADSDNLPTAVAKNEGLVEINIPTRFAAEPERLLNLIEHLYLDPSPQFVKPQAQQLAKSLVEDASDRSRAVSLAWKGLGPNTVPILRGYYNHADMDVRNAALEAGSWLNDKQSIAPLKALAQTGSPAERVSAARALVTMTRSSDARNQVRAMLDDPDPEVRLGAYEALTMVRDLSIERLSVNDGKSHKFYIDRVPSKYPGIYALQGNDLAIVIFGGDIPLGKNVFSRIDDTIMLSSLSTESIPVGLAGRFEGETAFVPIHSCGAITMIPSLTPVSKDPDAKLPPPDWSVQIGDKDGNKMFINIRDQNLQDVFGKEILSVPGRNEASEEPRVIAMVRIKKLAGKDDAGNPTAPIGELITLQSPNRTLPIAVRYAKPGSREAKIYRVTPTVATLAYTLGYKIDGFNTQVGPDLSFTQVVRALYTLCEQKQIDAPFEARINPLAQRIAAIQKDDSIESRPEINPGDFEELDALGKPKPPVDPGPASDPAPSETDPGTAPGTDPENTPLSGGTGR